MSSETGSQAEGDHGALYPRLRSQVEFYFSPQNLARDSYLRNMLTSEHPDMPAPPPYQIMCPVGIITNFPKVRDICVQFGEGAEPPPLLLMKALEGSNIATVSSDGNWIGPASQQLPPPVTGGQPPRAPMHQQFQQGMYPPNQLQPGQYPNIHQQRMMPPGPMQQGGMMPYPAQFAGQPSPGGSECPSPSSASIESSPSQRHKPQAQQGADQDVVHVAVMDLPTEVNPIEILTTFTTESIRPKSAFVDGNTGNWFVAFSSEADAKSAIATSSERTIGGAPVKAKLKNELPESSQLSVASASAVSLSSMTGPGGQMSQQQQQQLMGIPPAGGYPMAPSPPLPMGAQNIMMPGQYPGGPQYRMHPQMQPMGTGMPPPPGQPYLQQPFYNQMQQMYPPGNYMPMQQQQIGGPQQMQMQMPPYPMQPPRYGPGGLPPPPPPPRGYPPPYPMYQGGSMPQYDMGDGYGGGQHYQQHQGGHHPAQHHQFHDRRPGGQSGFYEHKKRNGEGHNKKKKNKSHQYQQQQGRRNLDNNNHGDNYNHPRHGNSTSPVPCDHRGGSKWKHKQNHQGDQSFRRGNGSPASFNSHYNNRHNQQNRLSGSDTASSRRSNKADENREIFTSLDFPGLGGAPSPGNDESDKSSQVNAKPNSNLVGYASALLKKKEAENSPKNCSEIDANGAATPHTAENDDIESVTRQTEELEREILSEFHDLSLIGDGNNNDQPAPPKHHQADGAAVDNTTEGRTVATASSSTIDAQSMQHNSLPILPAGPFTDQNDSIPHESIPEASASEPPPPIDVTCSRDFPAREPANARDGAVVSPSDVAAADSSVAKEQTPPSASVNPAHHAEVKAKPAGVWGSKKLVF